MKVLDLRCAQGHGFEGWFGSGDDFEKQRTADLIECPVCGDTQVAKLLAAPRLNLSGVREPASSSIAETARAATWAHAVREVLSRTEDVGERFAEEARKMHYGEREERAIRGRATPEQADALVEEGIEVIPLHLPAAFKRTLQ